MKIIAQILLVFLTGCSLMGENQWSAYSVTVDVQNETGNAIENAKLESNNIKTKKTNETGRAILKFRSAGLHVITITAEKKITRQIKVSLPQDDNKIINVTLNKKP